jgi:hypothetical protein
MGNGVMAKGPQATAPILDSTIAALEPVPVLRPLEPVIPYCTTLSFVASGRYRKP